MAFPSVDGFATMLVEQYRMNELIMQWSSHELYHDRLVAHGSVASATLGDLGKFPPEITSPLLFVDTAGALMYEEVEDSKGITESKFNYGETDLVVQVVNELLTEGISCEHIGVISPYSAQVTEIRKALRKDGQLRGIEVSTVDGFQGREKEIIIISMVRSNPTNTIGFLSNERRMNVAVTRAKKLCVLIGDSATVGKNTFLKSLCDYFMCNG